MDPVEEPLALDLAVLGIMPGDEIQINRLGDFSYTGAQTETAVTVIAVFSASDSLLGPGELARVVDAVATIDGTPVETPMTNQCGTETDIPQDFAIFGTSPPVTVPETATFLFVCASDEFYGDNTDMDGDFGVEVLRVRSCDSVTSIPVDAVGPKPLMVLPNPTRGSGFVSLQIESAGRYEVAVFDVLGRPASVTWTGWLSVGTQRLPWLGPKQAGRSLSAGRYYVVVRSDEGKRWQAPVTVVK